MLGSGWSSSRQLYYEPSPFNIKLSKLSEDKNKTIYAITGKYLSNLTIVSDQPVVETIPRTDTLIVFRVNKTALDKMKNIILAPPIGEGIVLSMPDSAPKAVTPKVTEADPAQIFIKSSKTVKFKGEGLSAIKQAIFEGQDLQIVKKSDAEIVVLLTREVTKEAGEVEIIFRNEKDTTVGKILVLEPAKPEKP